MKRWNAERRVAEMGDLLIDATGFVWVDFNRNNHVVHMRLNYHVYTRKRDYHAEITNTDSLDSSFLKKLKEPKIKAKILGLILDDLARWKINCRSLGWVKR